LSLEETNGNDVWVSIIANAGYFLEIFYAKDLVIWCIENFEKDQRIIKLNGWSPISLALATFNQILKLLKPTTSFKIKQDKYFIKYKNDDRDFLPQCLKDSTTVLEDLSMI
jgi:hypothetical protein